MPKYKLSAEERAAKQERMEKLRELMAGLEVNDVLGIYVGENESAKYWLSILNGLRNRGAEDILIACVDGLRDFPRR